MQKATEITGLNSAFVGMARGITRPARVRWLLDDAARGKPVRPLGRYPEVALECLEAGASFPEIIAPLTTCLAHIRRRCSSKLPTDWKQALLAAKRVSDEAESKGLSIAMSVSNPGPSALVAEAKEAREASLIWERVAEDAESKLAEMEAEQ